MCGKVNNDKNHNYKIWRSALIVENLSIARKVYRFTCIPARSAPVLICMLEGMASSKEMIVIIFLKHIEIT